MPHELSPGKPNTRRYTPAEKERAVRAVRQLRKELGTEHGTIRRVADQLGIGVESLRNEGRNGVRESRSESLVTPSNMLATLGPALGVALALMLVARPIAVWLCLWPFHFSAREVWFISWVGLRGAVPIVLALFPLLAGVPQAGLLFNIAFVVVLVSLVAQGSTIGLAARRLGVALPPPDDEVQRRKVFRDFAIDPSTPVAQLCEFYDLPPPAHAALPLAQWMVEALRRPPVVGDSVRLGHATLVVRAVDEGRITQVGLGLQED